jgi:hypothetical protein
VPALASGFAARCAQTIWATHKIKITARKYSCMDFFVDRTVGFLTLEALLEDDKDREEEADERFSFHDPTLFNLVNSAKEDIAKPGYLLYFK